MSTYSLFHSRKLIIPLDLCHCSVYGKMCLKIMVSDYNRFTHKLWHHDSPSFCFYCFRYFTKHPLSSSLTFQSTITSVDKLLLHLISINSFFLLLGSISIFLLQYFVQLSMIRIEPFHRQTVLFLSHRDEYHFLI